jgi:hypothetical protein
VFPCQRFHILAAEALPVGVGVLWLIIPPVLSKMVRVLRVEFEVLNPVVVLDAVDVVDNLRRG